MRRLAEEMAAQQERERQWRVARGTATAEDLRGPICSGPAERDTWMTELPEARRPNVQPSQVNVVGASCFLPVTGFILHQVQATFVTNEGSPLILVILANHGLVHDNECIFLYLRLWF